MLGRRRAARVRDDPRAGAEGSGGNPRAIARFFYPSQIDAARWRAAHSGVPLTPFLRGYIVLDLERRFMNKPVDATDMRNQSQPNQAD